MSKKKQSAPDMGAHKFSILIDVFENGAKSSIKNEDNARTNDVIAAIEIYKLHYIQSRIGNVSDKPQSFK